MSVSSNFTERQKLGLVLNMCTLQQLCFHSKSYTEQLTKVTEYENICTSSII